MQNKKIAALIVLSVLAVISLIYGLTASPKGKSRKYTTSGQLAISPYQQGAAGDVVAVKRRAKRSRFKVWNRNPFVSGSTGAAATELALNGIIWNKVKPKAMIGDAIVVKGDVVGGNRVVDIQPNKVILNDGTKEFELKMEK